MAVTAQAGIVGYAPQESKSTVQGYTAPTSYYKTKATLVDLAVLDDTRTGDDEVGGRPVPTFPYKAGVVVGGGLSLQPRLENIFGWLLYGALGKVTTTPSVLPEAISSETLTGSPQVGHAVADDSALAGGAYAVVKFKTAASGNLTGDVVLHGTDGTGTVSETFSFSNATAGTVIRNATASRKLWLTITTVDLPAGTNNDVVTIGIDSYFSHVFTIDDANPSYVPWMTFVKHIPRYENDADSDIGEIFEDCKVVGLTMSLAADRPINARVDVLGRTFALDEDPENWTYDNDFEEYPTIPIGCETSGYIKVDAVEMPIVQANVAWQNVPLDTRMDRVYGDPFLEDITIVRRQLAFDLLVKWNNADLYRDVLTGATTGTSWTAAPKVGNVEVLMSSYEPTVSATNHSLKIYAQQVMLAMNGGITLAGGQAVMMRFNGVALDPATGDYAQITLVNNTPEYVWPAP